MHIHDIESLPEIAQAAHVLRELEKRGLKQPAIAGGYIRNFLINKIPSDIDICYVGAVHYDEAQKYLAEILSERKIDSENWDVAGIWNAEIANPAIVITEQHILRDYVCSIDSVSGIRWKTS